MWVPAYVGQPAYRLYQWAWAGLDWLYPPNCGGCGQRGVRWCPGCQANTRVLPNSVCKLCGQVQSSVELCPSCRAEPPDYTSLRSWAVFGGPLRSALHRLKYKGDVALGEALARPLIVKLRELGWIVDLVTPVPLGIARQAERGYNQAALLAWPLALANGIPYLPHALEKIRETTSQVGLTLTDRRKNVAGAFQARQKLVAGKRVLVVDDVTTSGATFAACSAALVAAGATEVYGLTLARAVQPESLPPTLRALERMGGAI